MLLSSINELLSHIKEVEADTIRLSQESMLMLSGFIEKNGIPIDDEAAIALQYQDIISQQLNATIEAITTVQNSINVYQNAYKSDEKMVTESFSKLHTKLSSALSSAKNKREAFSGNVHSDNEDSIEFF